MSSAGWWTANDQTPWEPEGPVGAIEVNSVEPRNNKHDRWGQEWLMLNWDSGAVVTAFFVAVAGDLPLEKQGEFRVASGAVIPNLGKIKMKSTDESGVARSIRGHITEVAKPLLSAVEVSRSWDSLLFEDGGILLERNSPVALEVRAISKNHRVWDRHGKSIRLYREGNMFNAYVRTGDVVEPAEESWTRPGEMDVDDGDHDEQDEAEQPEEHRRVLAAPKHFQTNHAVFAPWCEVCAKAKGTGAQHRRQTVKELAKQEQDGPIIYSDFFYMSEAGAATAMLALKFSRSGRVAATALEQKGLSQYGVKFFAGFIQQTGIRRFINKSDGEPAMKALKRVLDRNHQWEITKRMVTSSQQ